MKAQYDLIIFDWDGTLIDSIDWIVECIQFAANACNCEIPSARKARDGIGLSLQGLMESLYPDADSELIESLMQIYSQRYLTWEINREHLFDGAYQTLETLNAHGFKMAVATGKTRRGLNAAMRATGTEGFFISSRCADETASKPDPLMLHEILQHTGIENHRALMVGDSAHDMAMAVEAGIDCIAVSCGVHDLETLAQYAPKYSLHQTTEILNLL